MTLVSLILFSLDKTIFVPLQVIEIYFDTGTYDNIERDVKVTINAQLGLIGGTMGLLTGFSILSAVEIVYYLGRFLMSAKFFTTVRSNEAKQIYTKSANTLNASKLKDISKDFLESSTIHGLQYISRSQVCFFIKEINNSN